MFRFSFWQPVWYYQPRQSFPKTKMLKGRFLGIAQNIGDAFCFLILTQPEPDDDSQPQVLARSVIRKRYPRELPPIVEHNDSTTTSLTFYKGDERTPLEDPISVSESGVDDVFSDVVADISPDHVRNTLFTNPNGVLEEQEPYDDGILEVYGPPTTRPRLSDDVPAPCSSVTNDIPLQRMSQVPEEQPVMPDNLVAHDPIPNVLLASSPSNDDPALLSNTPLLFGHSRFPAALAPADSSNDGLAFDLHERAESSGPSGDIHPITQDEDVDSSVLVDVTHQLSRVAADSTDDESFERLDSHVWKDGVLHFVVLWKTDETSCLPFSTVKLDFPLETADYILKHKLGCADGKYVGGRYTRWARQFKRQHTQIVRRLLRDSGRRYIRDGAACALTIASALSDGTRLIRRVATRTPTTSGGSRKRKKPGRLSRPLEVKYGVPFHETFNMRWSWIVRRATRFGLTLFARRLLLCWLDCFEFHGPDYKPNSDYQWTKLSMIFEVKQDGRRKARLVAGGHMVDPMGINSRSTVVKGISVRLLDLIAHRDNLPILCGDIGNAFITANCLEKIYSRAGPEFDDREGSIMILRRHFTAYVRQVAFRLTSRIFTLAWILRRDMTVMFG
ncbi:hypothetical protein MHU86_8302 [Fragilaria crotonensis]|nr:hypothetical protein MHU86_8302 [Fragilaria crotonensis]